MNMDLKKIGGSLILAIGIGSFILSISNNDLNYALIFLTAALILSVLYALLLDAFDVRIFAGVISASGFLVAISVLFMFGIEEVPYPIGAIVFHSGGLAGALGIGFFSCIPILILYQTSNINSLKHTQIKHHVSNNEVKPVIFSEDWELASDHDLISDKFEKE